MDGIANLLKPVLESEHSTETLKNILESCADQRAFSQLVSGIPSFVGTINSRLNEPSSRNEGLLLLHTFLPQCSQDVLVQNASSWIQFCLKGIALAETSRLSFVVLKMLIKVSVTAPELTRYVSSVAIPSFAEVMHQGIFPQAYVFALECLEACMVEYNGPCGPHKKVIERFLLSMMDYMGPEILQVFTQAAHNMALLPQIGGGGVGGAQYKLAWAAQHRSLCRTIHIILDDLYSETNELKVNLMGTTLEGIEPLKLPQFEDADPILRTQKLVARLHAVSASLQCMLVMEFPVPKTMSLTSIMNVICRGLSVNGSSIGARNTTHSLALAADLPKVHYSMMKLLEALIMSVRSNMLPFAGLICRLGVQSLKWTQVDDWPYGTERPFRTLRIQTYNVLRLWFGTAKSGSLVEQVAQQFVDLALQDIYSEKESVSLSAALSKKIRSHAKRKGSASPGAAAAVMSRNGTTLNATANKHICLAALQATTAMVMSAWFKIQPGLHKLLQETIVTIFLKVPAKSGELPVPYTEAEPRLELYRLLLQLVLDGHPVWPAPTGIALQLFSRGLHDSSAEISMFCGMAQSAVEKIVHPGHPSLHLAPNRKELEACIEDTSRKLPAITLSKAASNCEGSDEEIVDSVFMTPQNAVPRPSLDAITSTPSAAIVLNGGFKSAVTPNKVEVSQAGNVVQKLKDLNLATDANVEMKVSPVFERVAADSNNQENGSDARRTIDLTTSDIDDDDEDDNDISELPYEINLADSEDDKDTNVTCSNEGKVASLGKEDCKETDLKLKSPVPDKELNSPRKSGVSTRASSVVLSNGSVSSLVSESKDTPGKRALEEVEETGKSAAEEEEKEGEESASKKQKLNEDLDFASDEDSMLLSFVDVTREEEEDDDLI